MQWGMTDMDSKEGGKEGKVEEGKVEDVVKLGKSSPRARFLRVLPQMVCYFGTKLRAVKQGIEVWVFFKDRIAHSGIAVVKSFVRHSLFQDGI